MTKTYIIAEVGPNHNGSYKVAIKYIEQLYDCGLDAIKFQFCNPEKLLSLDAFQLNNNSKNKNIKDIFSEARGRQLSKEEHKKLFAQCKEMKIDYLCSAFDLGSLKFLNEDINLKKFKIPSGEIFSLDMLKYIREQYKPIILSTGMATFDEIEKSINYLNLNERKDITLLHCISNYPTSPDEVNMRVMQELKKRFKYPVGFSDHTIDNSSSLTAVAMGASIIEKHVTLDQNMSGPDHKSSSTIKEFKELVKSIRKIEKIMGEPIKKISKKEKDVSEVARKSIVSNRDILQGDTIREADISFKRPGTGILPLDKDFVVGKKVSVKIKNNKIIKKEYLKK